MASSTTLRRELSLCYAIAALLSFGLAVPLAAQPSGPVLHTAPPPDTASSTGSDVSLITVPVIIHDKHGALIQNISQDQFQLWVDKKPADIRSFARDTNLPLTLGLLVDVSPSQRDALAEERKATTDFLSTTLTAADKAFVVQFARQADLLQDSTGSKPQLQAGLQQLGTASPGGDTSASDSTAQTASNNGGNNGGQNGGNNGGNNGPYGGNGPYGSNGPYGRGRNSGNSIPDVGAVRRPNTVLYDALFLSSDEVIAKQTGLRVLIVLTDGSDHGSKESLASAIEAAQRADTIVYAIYVKGLPGKPDHSDRGFSIGDPNQCDPYGPPGGYPGSYPPYGRDCSPTPRSGSVESSDGRKTLERIADQTGGRVFELDKRNSLADIYKQIADELRAQYRIAFAPNKDQSFDGYHRIDVSLKGDPKDLFVQTREGYYAGPPD